MDIIFHECKPFFLIIWLDKFKFLLVKVDFFINKISFIKLFAFVIKYYKLISLMKLNVISPLKELTFHNFLI